MYPNILSDFQLKRRNDLNREIHNAFDHLAIDEVEILASEFENATTRMIEVIDMRVKSALVMDLFDDVEFSPVVFPQSISSLLIRHDVFLVTLGLRKGKWYVVFMSPLYDVCQFTDEI